MINGPEEKKIEERKIELMKNYSILLFHLYDNNDFRPYLWIHRSQVMFYNRYQHQPMALLSIQLVAYQWMVLEKNILKSLNCWIFPSYLLFCSHLPVVCAISLYLSVGVNSINLFKVRTRFDGTGERIGTSVSSIGNFSLSWNVLERQVLCDKFPVPRLNVVVPDWKILYTIIFEKKKIQSNEKS